MRGDEEAFSSLVESYHPKIFRLVRGIVGDWHHSEDICQDIFLIIYRKLRGFRFGSTLSTWVYRVALNASLKARKKKRKWLTESPDALLHVASPEDRRNARLEGNEVLRKLLSPLPEKLRTAVVLREQVGLSYDEMSEVLGCSRGAVEQRLHRAMVLLRQVWKGTDWLER